MILYLSSFLLAPTEGGSISALSFLSRVAWLPGKSCRLCLCEAEEKQKNIFTWRLALPWTFARAE